MKFERKIPIGLDARRKKWQGGAIKAPPPMGLGLSCGQWIFLAPPHAFTAFLMVYESDIFFFIFEVHYGLHI